MVMQEGVFDEIRKLGEITAQEVADVTSTPEKVSKILKALFDEDQADRPDDPAFIQRLQTDHEFAQTFLTELHPKDRVRRDRALEIMSTHPILTADDYNHLSSLFQHGETPGDYATAFLYSMKAVRAGLEPYLSLIPQSFDRYAVNTDHSQRYGTQQSGLQNNGAPIIPGECADDLSENEKHFLMLTTTPPPQELLTEEEIANKWETLPHEDREIFLSEITQRFLAMN